MPLYDFKCRKCKKVSEFVRPSNFNIATCPTCSGIADKQFPMTKFSPPRPFVCYDLGDEPVKVNNLKHLERECRKRGLDYEIGPTKYTKRERIKDKLKKKVEEKKSAFA